MRRVAAVLGISVALTAVGLSGQRDPARATFQAIYDAYVAGDTAVVLDTIRRPEDLAAIRGDLYNAIGRWKRDWHPRHVVFVLEVATLGLRYPWAAPVDALKSARELLVARPSPVGIRPDEDEFELLAHHAAVALLLGAGLPAEVDRYLGTLGERVGPTPDTRRPRLVAPRFLLYSALAAESRARPQGTAVPNERATLTRAADLFDRAMAIPDNVAEARVRQAFLWHRQGQPAAALTRLGPLPGPAADRLVEFWRLMVRGKAQEALGAPAPADAEYRAAAALYPSAQTPLVSLAALFLAQGRTTEAYEIAAAARRQPPGAYDPWWDYWSSDMRFFNTWMQELRKRATP